MIIKRIFTNILLFFLLPIYFNNGFAKDIDLDGIYIKKDSLIYKRLTNSKVDAHQVISSLYIDKDIIFADWISGNEILYVKELPEINIIYVYNHIEHHKNEIIKLTGTITSVLFSTDGKFLFLKRLIITDDIKSFGETLILNIKTGKMEIEKSSYFFMNLTLSPEGNSILYEENRGIIEFTPDINTKTLFCSSSIYSDIGSSKNPTLLYLSPNRLKMLIVNGSGGFYNAKIVSKEGNYTVNGITSSTEISWLNNRMIAYRIGHTGNYSINIMDTKTKTVRNIVQNSLNTNMHYSNHSGILSFLKNQVIHIYKLNDNKIINIGIEGEDISFSPDGNRFISLLYKKLLLTNLNFIEKRNLLLKNNSKVILGLYKNLLTRSQDWINEYSYSYISRKVEDYKVLAGE